MRGIPWLICRLTWSAIDAHLLRNGHSEWVEDELSKPVLCCLLTPTCSRVDPQPFHDLVVELHKALFLPHSTGIASDWCNGQFESCSVAFVCDWYILFETTGPWSFCIINQVMSLFSQGLGLHCGLPKADSLVMGCRRHEALYFVEIQRVYSLLHVHTSCPDFI